MKIPCRYFFSAKYISLVRFVTILVEMKSKLNYIDRCRYELLYVSTNFKIYTQYRARLDQTIYIMLYYRET